jgi:hypothetical protein
VRSAVWLSVVTDCMTDALNRDQGILRARGTNETRIGRR